MEDRSLWQQLEQKFEELGRVGGNALSADWFSTAINENEDHWLVVGPGDARAWFYTLAEQGARYLGSRRRSGAWCDWLDHLKNEGLNFFRRSEVTVTDEQNVMTQLGHITRLAEVSGLYCQRNSRSGTTPGDSSAQKRESRESGDVSLLLNQDGHFKQSVPLPTAAKYGRVTLRAIEKALAKESLVAIGSRGRRHVLVESLLKYFPRK